MKKRLKRLICRIIGHNYLYQYKYVSSKHGYVNVFKCSNCKKKRKMKTDTV